MEEEALSGGIRALLARSSSDCAWSQSTKACVVSGATLVKLLRKSGSELAKYILLEFVNSLHVAIPSKARTSGLHRSGVEAHLQQTSAMRMGRVRHLCSIRIVYYFMLFLAKESDAHLVICLMDMMPPLVSKQRLCCSKLCIMGQSVPRSKPNSPAPLLSIVNGM